MSLPSTQVANNQTPRATDTITTSSRNEDRNRDRIHTESLVRNIEHHLEGIKHYLNSARLDGSFWSDFPLVRAMMENVASTNDEVSTPNSAVTLCPLPVPQLNSSPHSVLDPVSQRNMGLTHPVPMPSPLRDESVTHFNVSPRRLQSESVAVEQENRIRPLRNRTQLKPSLRPLTISSHSCQRSGSPFPPSPTRAADARTTYASCVGELSNSPDRNHFEDGLPFPPSRPVSPSPVCDCNRTTSTSLEYSSVCPVTPTRSSSQGSGVCLSENWNARGRYNAKLNLEVKHALRRFVFSDGKHGVFSEKQPFHACNRDKDASIPIIDEKFRLDNDAVNNHLARAYREAVEAQAPQPHAGSDGLPENNENDALGTPQALDSSEDTPSPDLTILSKLLAVFENMNTYEQFLSVSRSDAQRTLDVLQLLLDTLSLSNHPRNELITAMRRLSQRTEIYPSCLNLRDSIQALEDFPSHSGGYGDVHKAKSDHGEFLCFKVIRVNKQSSAEYVAKVYAREMIVWRQLSHPNLLPFYGLYRFQNQISLVSPWAENGQLSDYLTQNPFSDRVLFCLDTAAGLEYLHKHTVVHGDIKAANVLVDGSRRAYLADFGLTNVTDTQILHWCAHSSVASRGGSIRWQAPELHVPESNDAQPGKVIHNTKASDVYAWGCLCHEIFTGEIPFSQCASIATVILRKGLGDHPIRPEDGTPPWTERGLTTMIWDLMERCWESDPQQRPSISDLISKLDPEMPVDTRPPSRWQERSATRFQNLQSAASNYPRPELEDLDTILSRLLAT